MAVENDAEIMRQVKELEDAELEVFLSELSLEDEVNVNLNKKLRKNRKIEFKKLIMEFGKETVYKNARIAFEKYEGISEQMEKLRGICILKAKGEDKFKDVYYVRAIIKNRFPGEYDKVSDTYILKNAYTAGVTFEELKEIAQKELCLDDIREIIEAKTIDKDEKYNKKHRIRMNKTNIAYVSLKNIHNIKGSDESSIKITALGSCFVTNEGIEYEIEKSDNQGNEILEMLEHIDIVSYILECIDECIEEDMIEAGEGNRCKQDIVMYSIFAYDELQQHTAEFSYEERTTKHLEVLRINIECDIEKHAKTPLSTLECIDKLIDMRK